MATKTNRKRKTIELTEAQVATVREALELHLSMLNHDRTDYEHTPAEDARFAAREDVAFAILRLLEKV